MNRLAGVKFEKDTHGKVKKVILDMKHHAQFIEDYLDALDAKQRLKNATFIPWEDAKKEIEKHHGVEYDPEFVKKIQESRKQAKEERINTFSIENLWK